ncbi:hypothetical protein C8R46DRAFT_1027617 [Mycena filopes]|nr:hypothetical protein C8R46DRAFT_1027617 [Mycena filopes]
MPTEHNIIPGDRYLLAGILCTGRPVFVLQAGLGGNLVGPHLLRIRHLANPFASGTYPAWFSVRSLGKIPVKPSNRTFEIRFASSLGPAELPPDRAYLGSKSIPEGFPRFELSSHGSNANLAEGIKREPKATPSAPESASKGHLEQSTKRPPSVRYTLYTGCQYGAPDVPRKRLTGWPSLGPDVHSTDRKAI